MSLESLSPPVTTVSSPTGQICQQESLEIGKSDHCVYELLCNL